MRVMCIRNDWDPAPEAAHEPRPEIGDIDTVVKDFRFKGDLFYELERFYDVYYRADMFASLPDSTADEMAQAEREAIVNLEPAMA